MNEPVIMWYWDLKMMRPDEHHFWWSPTGSDTGAAFVIKCKANTLSGAYWNVCRVEFSREETLARKQQTMDTLLDVCRMRYADELLNQGERK